MNPDLLIALVLVFSWVMIGRDLHKLDEKIAELELRLDEGGS